MTKPVAHYLGRARDFDRLALMEPRVEVRHLLAAQADACYRLAARRARQLSVPIPYGPVGSYLVTRRESSPLAASEQPARRD